MNETEKENKYIRQSRVVGMIVTKIIPILCASCCSRFACLYVRKQERVRVRGKNMTQRNGSLISVGGLWSDNHDLSREGTLISCWWLQQAKAHTGHSVVLMGCSERGGRRVEVQGWRGWEKLEDVDAAGLSGVTEYSVTGRTGQEGMLRAFKKKGCQRVETVEWWD